LTHSPTRPVRLVVTVCPREPGVVRLPVKPGAQARRLDAASILRHLARLVQERGLAARVRLQVGCAGGCGGPGPNVSVTIYPATRPNHREDHVATAWKTYVYSLPTLTSLAAILDDNLKPKPAVGSAAAWRESPVRAAASLFERGLRPRNPSPGGGSEAGRRPASVGRGPSRPPPSS
jgi:hypothetical protein